MCKNFISIEDQSYGQNFKKDFKKKHKRVSNSFKGITVILSNSNIEKL